MLRESRESAAADAGGTGAVSRAAEIIRVLGRAPGEMSLAQVADRAGLPRSTAHRIVQTLEELGFVARGARGRGLRQGPEVARLTAESRADLVRVARPYLTRLARTADASVALSVLDGWHTRFLARAPVRRRPGSIPLVCRVPAHCTANGKALLAALPKEQLERTLPRQLTALTERTIASRPELLAELDGVRSRRVAFGREEYADGVCGIGQAVQDEFGHVAAITIAMPAWNFYGREDELRVLLDKTVASVDAALLDLRSVGAA